jgi:hypothetical protein
MTKTILALLGVLLLAACDKPLSNDEIIKQEKICADAGMKALAWRNNIIDENFITRVECQPNG